MNHTQFQLQVVSVYKWPTDSWELQPTVGQGVPAETGNLWWGSQGGFFRGCSNTVALQPVGQPSLVTFTITTLLKLGWMDPAVTCTTSNPDYGCTWNPNLQLSELG